MIEETINSIILDVAELPDRTSPADRPDAMLVTADELRGILRDRLRHPGHVGRDVVYELPYSAEKGDAPNIEPFEFRRVVLPKDFTPIGEATPAPKGVELIAEERKRQVEAEGWTPDHDDTHTDGSLAVAANMITYDLGPGTHPSDPELLDDPDAEWYERLAAHVAAKYADDPIRRLTIAGALIAAEIDRLQRLRGKV